MATAAVTEDIAKTVSSLRPAQILRRVERGEERRGEEGRECTTSTDVIETRCTRMQRVALVLRNKQPTPARLNSFHGIHA